MFNKQSKRLNLIDAALILVGIIAASAFFTRMGQVLDYQWNWKAIPGFFAYIDPSTGALETNVLLDGFILTLKISFWASFLAFFIGVVSGVMGAKGSFIQRFLSRTYVESIRNIPSLVLVIIFYYFISSQFLEAIDLESWVRSRSESFRHLVEVLFIRESYLNSFISAITALAIYEGAYVSEIIRGGIEGISKGQWEAAYSLGLSGRASFFLVILPQTLRRVAFPMAGQFISAIKDSAIVSVISIQELTFQGMELMSATFLTFEIWITITLLYFIVTFALSQCISFLEKRFTIHRNEQSV